MSCCSTITQTPQSMDLEERYETGVQSAKVCTLILDKQTNKQTTLRIKEEMR